MERAACPSTFFFFNQFSVKFNLCVKMEEVRNVFANLIDGKMLTPRCM